MEQNSFSWIYKIELIIQYKKIGGLMIFHLDCLAEDVNDKICMFGCTNGHLRQKCPSDLEWTTLKETRANTDLVSLAKALNGEGK
jgi:hypothetical protein